MLQVYNFQLNIGNIWVSCEDAEKYYISINGKTIGYIEPVFLNTYPFIEWKSPILSKKLSIKIGGLIEEEDNLIGK